MLELLIALVVVFVVGAVIWWLFFETEGVYLGRRVVIGLYDLYARRYDNIKQNDDVEEHLQLAQPLMTLLYPQTDPLVLDVATGTGRIPLALCQHARFEGHIVGMDLSRGMLQQAARKIQAEHFEDYVTLLWADGQRLPFDDASFDLVTCMEAWEFMPVPEAALKECIRVLRPGGVLLTTNRNNNIFMPGRLWSQDEMQALLHGQGIEDVEFKRWQLDYTLVWGRKAGKSRPIGVRPIEDVLHCPQCGAKAIALWDDEVYLCEACDTELPYTRAGVIQFYPMRKESLRTVAR